MCSRFLMCAATALIGLAFGSKVHSLSPDITNGMIAFSDDVDGNSDIFLIHPDGTGLINITNNPAHDIQPTWSPDGLQLAFASNREGNFELYKMDSDGTHLARLTDLGQDARSPEWSPDGNYISFEYDDNGDYQVEIWIMNADGTDPHPITDSEHGVFAANWSPDSTRLVLSVMRDGRQADLYLADADGSHLRAIIADPKVHEVEADWSPDGKYIIFIADYNSHHNIYRGDADGTNIIRLSSDTQEEAGRPMYSPDGTQIVYSRNASNYGTIWVMDSDGGNPYVVFDGGDSYGPEWQPLVSQ